jgi:tetratricopeptide (TPR) repeat protein
VLSSNLCLIQYNEHYSKNEINRDPVKKHKLITFDRLSNLQVGIIIFCVGLLTYFDGLSNQFLGDDTSQIVTNVPVQSLANIRIFFTGGTFYNGGGLEKLSGVYYRPLQTTFYSLIYTVFGANPFFFHLFQLLLCIASAFFLYLIFKLSFKPSIALPLALVFLVHPINAQTAFAIANMQDALYFFFGITSLWVLFSYKSKRSIVSATLLLLLSLLAKETALLFIILAIIYLFWYRRKQLKIFLPLMLPISAGYVLLRVRAIGWLSNPNNAPIDRISFIGRLCTSPSIALLYITKFIFPWKLSSAYYWTEPAFSFYHVLLPLLIDTAVIGLLVYLAMKMRKRASRSEYHAFLYFAIWSGLGFVLLLQFIRLDFTAEDPWFYFSCAGILGMIGMLISVLKPLNQIKPRTILIVICVVLFGLALRTALLGRAWNSQYSLARNDLSATNDDYQANYQLAVYYFNQQNYQATLTYAERSVAQFPYATNLGSLGVAQMELGDFRQAQQSYEKGLTYFIDCSDYGNLSVLTDYYGSPIADRKILIRAIDSCPGSAVPWYYLATLDYKQHNFVEARYAITEANQEGAASTIQGDTTLYEEIMNGQTIN